MKANGPRMVSDVVMLTMIPYDEEEPLDEMLRRLKEARKVVAKRQHTVDPDNLKIKPKHNHFTRDIKAYGDGCLACDNYWTNAKLHEPTCVLDFPHDNECECWCHGDGDGTRRSYKDRGAEFDAWEWS